MDVLYMVPLSIGLSFALITCAGRFKRAGRREEGVTVEPVSFQTTSSRQAVHVVVQQPPDTQTTTAGANNPEGGNSSSPDSDPPYDEPLEVIRNARSSAACDPHHHHHSHHHLYQELQPVSSQATGAHPHSQLQENSGGSQDSSELEDSSGGGHYEVVRDTPTSQATYSTGSVHHHEYNKISVREPLSRVLEGLEHTYNEVDDERMSSFYEEIPGSDSSSVAYARIGPRTVGLSANQASRGRERSRTPTPPPPPPPPPPMSGAYGANSVAGATGGHDVELLSELSEVRRALDRERKLRLSLEDRIKALEAQLLQQLQQKHNVTSNNVIANRNSNPLEDIVDSPSSSSHPQPTTIVIQGGQTYSSNHPSHRSITGNNSWHPNIPSTQPVPIPGRVTLQITSSSRPQLADGEGDYLVSEHPVNSSPSSSSTSSTHTVHKTPSIRQNHLAGGRMINSTNSPSPTVTATTSITSPSIFSTTTTTTTTTSRSGGVTVSRIITDNL